MSRILTQDELNDVKTLAESLGFYVKILENCTYAYFRKRINEYTTISIYYNVIAENSYTEINCGRLSLKTDEYKVFVKALGEAQRIAKELEK